MKAIASKTHKNTTTSAKKNQPVEKAEVLKLKATKIVVQYDCGFSNALFIRGEGIPGLSWEKGTLMKCTKNNEWVFQTRKSFKNCQFKILINDTSFEVGENRSITCGKTCSYTPQF